MAIIMIMRINNQCISWSSHSNRIGIKLIIILELIIIYLVWVVMGIGIRIKLVIKIIIWVITITKMYQLNSNNKISTAIITHNNPNIPHNPPNNNTKNPNNHQITHNNNPLFTHKWSPHRVWVNLDVIKYLITWTIMIITPYQTHRMWWAVGCRAVSNGLGVSLSLN